MIIYMNYFTCSGEEVLECEHTKQNKTKQFSFYNYLDYFQYLAQITAQEANLITKE